MKKHIKHLSNKAKNELKKLRKHVHKTLNHPTTPEEIAGAVALGVFLSALPTFWLHFPIIIALMFLVPILARNKVPFLLGTLVNNTFTAIFTFPLAYNIGKIILGYGIPFSMQLLMTPTGFWMIYKQLFIGCAIIGAILAIAAFVITCIGIITYRKLKK